MNEKRITVLLIEPGLKPCLRDIDNTLPALQASVGGTIQVLYPFDDAAAIICNDEGKLLNLPLNRALTDESGMVYDIIAGTFLVVGLSMDDFDSLPADLIEKYTNRFAKPETFIHLDGQIYIIRG